ncbi:hypothetical protein PPACK8108_LOCUS12435 [Phakopsora pachyrhizi]|uniref:Uncharacterized protein n=1 Tax=Phakopsora pachyrhizi TaxID=170000 RepID=A0AAV0B3U8_PHAPC|nr:hypothetical protein PPACK8108_LOCUS12435 [Phakopsora pachyrhizi]
MERKGGGKGGCGEGEKWMGLEGARWVTALKGQKEFPYVAPTALGKPESGIPRTGIVAAMSFGQTNILTACESLINQHRYLHQIYQQVSGR